MNLGARNVNLHRFVEESNKIEGILREPSPHEVAAHTEFLMAERLTIVRVKALVAVCQPNAVIRDKPNLNVRVGDHIAPQGGPEIVEALQKILDQCNEGFYTPYALHHGYETLHPFTDGNGRSGRAIWLWCMKGNAPLGFLHHWYYQSLSDRRKLLENEQ